VHSLAFRETKHSGSGQSVFRAEPANNFGGIASLGKRALEVNPVLEEA
jgi:hypothetical protein